MISQTSEYALRAIVHLADQAESSLTTPQIAETTRVPVGYLAKVLGQLAKAGLVRSQRGLHGGFSIARAPQDITVLDVINAVDPVQRIHTCPLGLKAHGKKLCPLHRQLDDAMASIERAFGSSTIADLLADPSSSKPLCDVAGGRRR
ncbi:MAG: Rrf2 family transcriptional regulator [Phycisphaeraceae bacterium]